MTTTCFVCLGGGADDTHYHSQCAKALFGSTTIPRLNLEIAKLHTAALAMVGKTSLSGAQKKISVNISADQQTLQVATGRGFYILKPPTETYPYLPENEHTTMLLAKLSGLNVGQFGLVRMEADRIAFLSKRFDRNEDGSKLHQEDFCQLSEKPPSAKYDGSAELCARIVKRFATEPGIELLRLFEQLVFSWWVGNGDLHLKNLSLLIDAQETVRLTPAYDLVSTILVINEDPLAMPLGGRDRKLQRSTWVKFANYCDIGIKAANRVLDRQITLLPKAEAILDQSFLPADMKTTFKQHIANRTAELDS